LVGPRDRLALSPALSSLLGLEALLLLAARPDEQLEASSSSSATAATRAEILPSAAPPRAQRTFRRPDKAVEAVALLTVLRHGDYQACGLDDADERLKLVGDGAPVERLPDLLRVGRDSPLLLATPPLALASAALRSSAASGRAPSIRARECRTSAGTSSVAASTALAAFSREPKSRAGSSGLSARSR
jgi:hypothetical protein